MRKIGAIAWKEVFTTFTDRNSVLIMIATPLALSIIIGLAFSRVGGSDVPVQDIPVAVVNLDRGNLLGVNFGQVYVTALVPNASGGGGAQAPGPDCNLDAGSVPQPNGSEDAAPIDLFDLTDAVLLDAPVAQALVADGDAVAPGSEPGTAAYITAVARSAVENGRYTAAIIIPEDFSTKLSYIPGRHPQLEETEVALYANSGRPIAAQIIRSIVEGITNQILTGNITVAATWYELEASGAPAANGSAMASPELLSAFACAFSPDANTLSLDTRTIPGAGQGNAAVDALVMFGSAQAIFFGLFTAGFGVLSMYDDRRNWTLQRLVMSPTPRSFILAGKLAGVAVTVLFQITLLLLALTLVGSVIKGELLLIWGSNVPLILMVLLSATMAVSGYGMFMAGIVKTPEQGQIIGSMLTIGLAALGGTFGFTLPEEIASFSLIYWGRTAFENLASGQTDVGLHIAVLCVQGVVLYGLGVLFFNRNFEL
jgi:ABC-type Na+ efflux pump permease subunit